MSYHKLVAWSMVLFTWIHATAHWINFAQLSSIRGQGPKGFFLECFATGPGWSGHIMLFSLMLIALTSMERIRLNQWQRFWSTHHLFLVFFIFWSIHGAFASNNADESSTWTSRTTFWQYWLIGALVYLLERTLREVRGLHKTHISKVVQHPNNVVEVQIMKKEMVVEVGQARISYTVLLVDTNPRNSTSTSVILKSQRCNGGPSSLPALLRRII